MWFEGNNGRYRGGMYSVFDVYVLRIVDGNVLF